MASVALFGFAPSRHTISRTQADEIWSVNYAYLYEELDEVGLDLLVEIHPKWILEQHYDSKMRLHWEWLQRGDLAMPIYMVEAYPEVPQAVAYPLEEIEKELFVHLLRADGLGMEEPEEYWTSGVMYLLALAIYCGRFERIELHGIDMINDTEHRHQVAGFAWLVGLANGRGIEVILQPECPLFKALKYGFGRGQMIGRQDLEMHLRKYYEITQEALHKAAKLEGRLEAESLALANGAIQMEDFEKIVQAGMLAREEAARAEGAFLAVQRLIQVLDLEEPEDFELKPILSVRQILEAQNG